MRLFTLVFTIFASSLSAGEVFFEFQWIGGQGYSMQGALAYDDALASSSIVTGDDLHCFQVTGFKDGAEIGSWGLGQKSETTAWRLHLLPREGMFLHESAIVRMPQAWNMAGDGSGCGKGGFGFNIGNFAQDICVDDTLIVESQVSSYKPFPARHVETFDFAPDACLGPILLSQLAEEAVAASR